VCLAERWVGIDGAGGSSALDVQYKKHGYMCGGEVELGSLELYSSVSIDLYTPF
jgi:hypothetical protein